jgi:hypothetical protein
MRALISKIEPRESGFRVAQVVQDSEEFGVASDLFWVSCDNTIIADQFWYDPITGNFNAMVQAGINIPVPVSADNQPKTTGTTTISQLAGNSTSGAA